MEIRIELPDDIAAQLEPTWGAIDRSKLEALAVKGYRDEVLTVEQVRRLLGFETRLEVDEFLKREGAYLHYTIEDFRADVAAHRIKPRV